MVQTEATSASQSSAACSDKCPILNYVVVALFRVVNALVAWNFHVGNVLAGENLEKTYRC